MLRKRLLVAATLVAALSASATVHAQQVITFDNADTSGGPLVGAPVVSYLAEYGITFSTSDADSPDIQRYPSWLDVVSSPNYFTAGGPGTGFTYDMSFARPLESLSFTIPGQGSATMAAWSATAYSASNVQLAEVGDPYITGSGSPTQTYTLNGPNIAYVVFSTNAENFAGDNLGFDNLSLNVPEPATWAMMLIGFAGLGAGLRSRRGRFAAGSLLG